MAGASANMQPPLAERRDPAECAPLAEADLLARRAARISVKVSSFDLERGMFDAEPLVQLVSDALQKRVLVRRVRHHQMCRQGHVGRAQSPNVQIVDFADSGK